MSEEKDDAARLRAQRRAFIRQQHPDAGGDPEEFVRGLARFDTPGPRPSRVQAQVYRSRRPDRVVRYTIRTLRRRITGQPTRRVQ